VNLNDIQTQTENFIKNKIGEFSAKTAIVLGSGLSDLTDEMDKKSSIPYNEIPNFNYPKIAGHGANFVYGTLHGVNVLFLQGRPHWYQGISHEAFHIFMQAIKSFGCEKVIMTNAAGAIDPSFPVGSIVSISDHINFQSRNPMIGFTEDNNCFVGLENCYDADLRNNISAIADKNKINLYEGVYVGTLGPCFETPAEIKMFAGFGGQVVGMSTIPEVITAKYYGLKIAVLSLISNRAAGCGDESLSHELTLSRVKMASGNMKSLISGYIAAS
jgi:inosine/guanosine/xanthosine phosphorylase family protein